MISTTEQIVSKLWIHSVGLIEKSYWARARRRGDSLPLPHFLVIGAQKAGTTWLYWNLKNHPQIFLPTPKELHYFDANFDKNFRHYLAYFKDADRPIRGEMTPCYSALTRSRVAWVRRLLGPSKKIVFILRDPVERAKSYALMELNKQQQRRPDQISEQDFIRHFLSKNSIRRTRYLDTYRIWSHFFGEENIHLDSYERVKACPELLLRDISAFVGADPDFEFPAETVRQVVYNNDPFDFPPSLDRFLEDLYGPEREFFQKVTKARLAS